MIISASRRTDIPAFYADWFFTRIKEGFLYVQNPMNRKQISTIKLDRSEVDCIIFWTKDASPMLSRLEELQGYSFYFLYTITGYGCGVEKNVPSLENSIETFKQLSKKLGPNRVIWRYDPIFLTKTMDSQTHLSYFKSIATQLKEYTDKCIISFLNVYQKAERNMKDVEFRLLNQEDVPLFAKELAIIGKDNNIKIETCVEEFDLEQFGIGQAKCIDDRLISELLGVEVDVPKDKSQRLACGCVTSADIGSYNTCIHHCLYCYANCDHLQTKLNHANHDPRSPLLFGKIMGDEKISIRKAKSFINTAKKSQNQGELF
jgi:DNA repair photolyase